MKNARRALTQPSNNYNERRHIVRYWHTGANTNTHCIFFSLIYLWENRKPQLISLQLHYYFWIELCVTEPNDGKVANSHIASLLTASDFMTHDSWQILYQITPSSHHLDTLKTDICTNCPPEDSINHRSPPLKSQPMYCSSFCLDEIHQHAIKLIAWVQTFKSDL